MSSNCYLITDEASNHCLCIDPASEKSEREIAYINNNGLILDYIILTHEHTDHTWGVNSLVERYPNVIVICSEVCKQNLAKEFQAYFLFYYDNLNYNYTVCRVDKTIEELNFHKIWQEHDLCFINTPGHSMGSICIAFDGVLLFTGDAFMQVKPYINKRNGSKEQFNKSVQFIQKMYSSNTRVFPGHGDVFKLKNFSDKLF